MKFFRRASGPSTLTRAGEASHARNWALAADLFAEHLKAYPADAAIWKQLGHAKKEAGDFGAARDAYERSLVLGPGNADTYLQMGHLFKLMGEKPRAHAFYTRALALDPTSVDAEREYVTMLEDEGAGRQALQSQLTRLERASAEAEAALQALHEAVNGLRNQLDGEADDRRSLKYRLEAAHEAIAALRKEFDWRQQRSDTTALAVAERVEAVRQLVAQLRPSGKGDQASLFGSRSARDERAPN